MNAKQELLQALLNTSNISQEAYSLLESIINGEGGSKESMIVEIIKEGTIETFNKTAGEIYAALEKGINVICKWPEDNYSGICYGFIISCNISYVANTKEIEQVEFVVQHYELQQYYAQSMEEYPYYSFD